MARTAATTAKRAAPARPGRSIERKFMNTAAWPRAQKCGGSNRAAKDQARGGKGSGGGDRPLSIVVRSDQRTSLEAIGGRSTIAGTRVGAAADEICKQDAAGIGHGTPSQISSAAAPTLVPAI